MLISEPPRHFIGIDVGTGSARACVINQKGDIVGLASENIGLWQPEQGYYVGYPPSTLHLLQTTNSWETGTIDQRHLALHLLLRPPDPEST